MLETRMRYDLKTLSTTKKKLQLEDRKMLAKDPKAWKEIVE